MPNQETQYQVADRIATITLDRPDKLNAWTAVIEHEVRAMAAAENDENIRVIVLTGAGRGFCAGSDMSLLSTVAKKGIDAAQRARAVRTAGGIGEGIGADFQQKYSYFPKCSCDSIGMSVRRCTTKRSRCRVNLVSLQQRGIYSSRLGSSWIIRASSG
jgi:hypothetical protein